MSTDDTPTLVKIIQCSRKTCGKMMLQDERTWKPRKEGGKTAVCPSCGCESFYTIDEQGRPTSMRQHDQYRDGIDPYKLAPSPRMGPKLRKEIMDVKARAIRSIVPESACYPEEEKTLDPSQYFPKEIYLDETAGAMGDVRTMDGDDAFIQIQPLPIRHAGLNKKEYNDIRQAIGRETVLRWNAYQELFAILKNARDFPTTGDWWEKANEIIISLENNTNT